MKLVIRADDVGYTDVCNIGAFETMENGVVTAADVMLDTPGTKDALFRLREMPWISTGWHSHFWGSPVLNPSKVPSLYNKETGHFRVDIHEAYDVNYEEALAECRAQMEMCISILGRPLDTGETGSHGPQDTPLARAITAVCDEYGIPYHYCYGENSIWMYDKPIITKPLPQWEGRKIYCLDPTPAHTELHTDSLTECEKYDPSKYYIDDRFGSKNFDSDAVLLQSWHPGYPDWYVYRLGDQGPYARNFILARIMDTEALTSARLKSWIKDNCVELINMRDALYGTKSYQNHLRNIGSELFVR